jgi:hypothetical protein
VLRSYRDSRRLTDREKRTRLQDNDPGNRPSRNEYKADIRTLQNRPLHLARVPSLGHCRIPAHYVWEPARALRSPFFSILSACFVFPPYLVRRGPWLDRQSGMTYEQ